MSFIEVCFMDHATFKVRTTGARIKMNIRALLLSTGTLILLTSLGCGGVESVTDQERFQEDLNKPAETAMCDQWRATVAGLKSVIIEGGTASTIQMEIETTLEDAETLNVMKLPEEHRATGSAILDKLTELKSSKPNEHKGIVKEMEELAAKLP